MATPEPITVPVRLVYDTDAVDTLRATTQALLEAQERLVEATKATLDLIAALGGAETPAPDPGMEVVGCESCDATGLHREGGTCPICQGHGVVQRATVGTGLVEIDPQDVARSRALSGTYEPENQREVLGFGDVPMPTMPRSEPDWKPCPEDVTGHTMGGGLTSHVDGPAAGRVCYRHARLRAYVFHTDSSATGFGICLLDHAANGGAA